MLEAHSKNKGSCRWAVKAAGERLLWHRPGRFFVLLITAELTWTEPGCDELVGFFYHSYDQHIKSR